MVKMSEEMPEFDKFDELKKEALDLYSGEVITLKNLGKKIGRTPQTIWNWRQDDPEFDEAMEKAKKKQKDMRLGAIEDKGLEQIMNGEAAASLTIFFLKNLGKGEWLDSHQIESNFEGKIEHEGGLDLRELHEMAKDDTSS